MANETIADIIAEMRKISAEKYRLSGENGGAYGNPGVYYLDFAQFAHVIAERLDAAHKREAAFHAMTCEANDRLREHLQIALDADKRERGDCAKLREALKAAKKYLDGYTVNILELRRTVDAALAAPPRNCDVMDWRTAWKIWREKFHPETPAGYSAVVKGTEAFMDWFAAPATEKEGGNDGRQ